MINGEMSGHVRKFSGLKCLEMSGNGSGHDKENDNDNWMAL